MKQFATAITIASIIISIFSQIPAQTTSQTILSEKPKLTPQQSYLLSFSGVLCAYNHYYLDRLEADNLSNKFGYLGSVKILDDSWSIKDKERLYKILIMLSGEGDRRDFELQAAQLAQIPPMELPAIMKEYKENASSAYGMYLAYFHQEMFLNEMLLSWDLTRIVLLIRAGYTAGYITEQYAWQLLERLNIAERMREKYDSWEQSFDHYLMGRNFWSYSETKSTGKTIDLAAMILSEMRNSPCKIYPTLEQNDKVLPSYQDHTKEIEIPKSDFKIPENTTNNLEDYPNEHTHPQEFKSKSYLDKVVFLKEGHYRVDKANLWLDSSKLIGANRDKVIIEINDKNLGIIISGKNTVIDSVTIIFNEDLAKQIEGNKADQDRSIIKAIKGNCIIRNCIIKNTNRTAIKGLSNSSVTIENCIITGNYQSIVSIGKELAVNNCFISENSNKGIIAYDGTAVNIFNNMITENGSSGIYIADKSFGKIENNYIKDNNYHGIFVRETENVEISNNISLDNKLAGIEISDSKNILAVNNHCHRNSYAGIRTFRSKSIQISGNKCGTNISSGITAMDGEKLSISGNINIHNGLYGINFNSQGFLRDNQCSNNMHPGILIQDNAKAILQSNSLSHNMFCGIRIEDNAQATLLNNTSESNLWAGLAIFGSDTKVKLENNSFIDNGAWGVVCLDGAAKPQSTGDKFENNYLSNDIEVKPVAETYITKFKKYMNKL